MDFLGFDGLSPLCVSRRRIDTWQIVYLLPKETCPTISIPKSEIKVIGVRANIHFGGQTEFCPNGEHNLFVTRPRQGEKNNNEPLQWLFLMVVPDERLLCYPTRNVSQVDGYLFRSG